MHKRQPFVCRTSHQSEFMHVFSSLSIVSARRPGWATESQQCTGNCLQYQFAWTKANFRFIPFFLLLSSHFQHFIIYSVVSLHCPNIYTIDWAIKKWKQCRVFDCSRRRRHTHAPEYFKLSVRLKKRPPSNRVASTPCSTNTILHSFYVNAMRCQDITLRYKLSVEWPPIAVFAPHSPSLLIIIFIRARQ